MRMNHIALTVSDRAASAAFYREHFGFDRVLHDDADSLLLSGPDGAVLALMPGTPPPDPGLTFHFGFSVADAEAVLAKRAEFAAAGVPETEWEEEEGGFLRLRVADPDNYQVEIFNS